MKLEINVPFLWKSFDYHEFHYLQKHLFKLSGTHLKYKELSIEGLIYRAVFFLDTCPAPHEIDQLSK